MTNCEELVKEIWGSGIDVGENSQSEKKGSYARMVSHAFPWWRKETLKVDYRLILPIYVQNIKTL